MSTLFEKASSFHALHVRGNPLVLFNVWDAGSAKAVEAAGARAIATGSWSVASANAYPDGEKVPLDLVIDNLNRIVRVTDLPVTADLESGYGSTPQDVARTIDRSIATGAVGCNIEDSDPASGILRNIATQVERIANARKAAEAQHLLYFINVRTDTFLFTKADTHESLVASAIERARAYADAGADGFFAPGLADRRLISRIVEGSPIPLNIMVTDTTPSLRELASLGVARVSHGPRPYVAAMAKLQECAREAMQAN